MPKRSKANGEGSIVYEADRKKYRAYIVDPDGKRLTKRFAIKADADKWLSEIKTDIAQKTYAPPVVGHIVKERLIINEARTIFSFCIHCYVF